MKQLYSLFAVVLLLTTALSANAQYRQGDEPLVSITAGQKVLLQNGREADMAPSYLKWSATSGDAISDYLTDKIDETSVLEFVDAGDGAYYIYNPANDSYVERADRGFQSDFKLHWTDNVSYAAAFTYEEVAAYDGTPALQFIHEVPAYGISPWYLCAVSPFARSAAGFSYIYNASYLYYNAWVVYAAEQDGGDSYLGNVLDTYFPAGFSEETWSVGDAPGTISQEVFDALATAYNNAKDAFDAGDKDEATYTALADALVEAFNNAVAAIKPIEPGYYFLRNYAVDGLAYAREDNDASGTFTRAYWTTTEVPETYSEDVAPYIWKVEASSDGTGYTLYSPYFEKYLARFGSYGVAIPLFDDPDQLGLFGIAYQGESYAQQGGYFNILNNYFGGRILRAITGSLGYSSASRDAKDDDALWQFVPVPDSFVAALEADKNSSTLLANLTELVENSNALYGKTKVYDSPITINGTLDTPGLIETLTTNAQEVTEGDAVFAIDSEVSTFFHTSWSDESEQPDTFHFVDVTLSEPVQDIAIKIVKRINAELTGPSSTHNPLTYTVYVLNGDDAQEVGTFKAVYDQGLKLYEESDDLIENMVSVNYLSLPAPASALRIEVHTTEAVQTGHPYFCFAEIGVFSAVYDAEHSPIENIPEAVRDEFLSALSVAEAELAEGTATQETIDALQAAYEAFNDAFADRSALRALLDEARSYEDEAIEDDELLGYYQVGSIETYHNALDAIEARIDALSNPTTEEFAQIQAEIEAAQQAFDAQLNKPDGSTLFFIQSASATGDNYDRYLYTSSNDVTLASVSDVYVDNPGGHLNYMWRIEAQADGTYLIRNAASGIFLGGVQTSTGYITSTYEETPLRIVSARNPGLLSIQNLDGQNVFVLDYQQGVVFREEGKGADGASFTFSPADFQGTYTLRLYERTQVVTLPFAVLGQVENGKVYTITGRINTEEGAFAQLKAVDNTSVLPAAKPFIVIADDGESEIQFYTVEETDGTAIEYVLTPTTAVGLVGTLESTTVLPPFSVLRSGQIDQALSSGQTVLANSGYFDFSTIDETTEAGDLQIAITDEVSGIADVLFTPAGADRAIYDLQGRRVQNLQRGGVYIIGGRKVIVK